MTGRTSGPDFARRRPGQRHLAFASPSSLTGPRSGGPSCPPTPPPSRARRKQCTDGPLTARATPGRLASLGSTGGQRHEQRMAVGPGRPRPEGADRRRGTFDAGAAWGAVRAVPVGAPARHPVSRRLEAGRADAPARGRARCPYRTCGVSFRQVMAWKAARRSAPAKAHAHQAKVRVFSVVDEEPVPRVEPEPTGWAAEPELELRVGPWSVSVRLASPWPAGRGRACFR